MVVLQDDPAATRPALQTVELRPYQEEALDAIEAAETRVRRQLVALPTGTGKTVIFSSLIRRRPGRSLVLAHRDELLGQAISKIRQVYRGAPVGLVRAETDERHAPIVVASIQTLSRPKRLQRLNGQFATVVVDEAHHATADSYMRVLQHVGAFEDDGPLVVGFTATPERGDRAGLDRVFQEIVFKRTILEMVEAGYLCDLRAVQVRLTADFLKLHTRLGDFSDSELEDLLLNANAPEHALNAYREHADGRKALIFTPTVSVAKAMAATFSEAGIAAESVDGYMAIESRRAVLARLRSGETRVLANCAVLTEGFDEPSIDCIIVARPTKVKSLYVQMIGRGTRLYPGKEDCLIVDLVGSTTRHDLMTAATLFGLPPRAIVKETVREAKARVAAAAREEEAQDGEVVTRAVDAFRGRSLHWIKAGKGFALQLEAGWLRMQPGEGESWDVVAEQRDRRPRQLARGLDLGYAQGFAEDYARANGPKALLDPAAPWRMRPASSKQIDLLNRLGIRFDPGGTAGDASDLISARMARRR